MRHQNIDCPLDWRLKELCVSDKTSFKIQENKDIIIANKMLDPKLFVENRLDLTSELNHAMMLDEEERAVSRLENWFA